MRNAGKKGKILLKIKRTPSYYTWRKYKLNWLRKFSLLAFCGLLCYTDTNLIWCRFIFWKQIISSLTCRFFFAFWHKTYAPIFHLKIFGGSFFDILFLIFSTLLVCYPFSTKILKSSFNFIKINVSIPIRNIDTFFIN